MTIILGSCQNNSQPANQNEGANTTQDTVANATQTLSSPNDTSSIKEKEEKEKEEDDK